MYTPETSSVNGFLQHLKPMRTLAVKAQKLEFQHLRSEGLWDHNTAVNLQ